MAHPQRIRGPVVMFDDDPDDAYSCKSHESEISDGGSYYSQRSRQSEYSRQSHRSRQSAYSQRSTITNPPEGYGLGRLMQRAVISVFAMGLLCICLYPELVQQGATGSVLEKEFVVKMPSKMRKAAAPSAEAEKDLEDIDSLAQLGFKTIKASSEPIDVNEPRKTMSIVDKIEDSLELDGETTPSIKINDSLSAKYTSKGSSNPKTTEGPTLEALKALTETLKVRIIDEPNATSTSSLDALVITALEDLVKVTKANSKPVVTHEQRAVEEPSVLEKALEVNNEMAVDRTSEEVHNQLGRDEEKAQMTLQRVDEPSQFQLEPEQDERKTDQSPQAIAKDGGYTHFQQDPQHLLLSEETDQSEQPLEPPGDVENDNFQLGQQTQRQDEDHSRWRSQTSTENVDVEFSQQVEQKQLPTLKPRTISTASAGEEYFQGDEDESNESVVSHSESFLQGQQMPRQDEDQSRRPSQTKNVDVVFSQQVEQKPMSALKPRTITTANAGDDYFQGGEDETNDSVAGNSERIQSQEADPLSTQMSSYLQSRIPSHQLGSSMHISELPSLEFNSHVPSQSGRPSSPDATHMQICRAILDQGQRSTTIMEHESICLDEYGTTNALAQIFLSTFLTRQAQSQGINIYYQHNCGRHRPNVSLIQELLPSPLLFNENLFQPMGRENLESFCQAVSRNGGSEGLSPIDIMLWNTDISRQQRNLRSIVRRRSWKRRKLQNQRPLSIMELYVPIIHENLVKASRHAREVDGALIAGYGVLKLTPDVVDQPVTRGRAAIILSCMDIDCQDHSIVPYFNYLMLIPHSVHVVDLVITKKCEDHELCKRYAYDFASNIRQFSPGAKVELIVANPSAADSFARLVEAEHVICGPGWGLPCIFPALSRSAEHGRVTLLEGDSQEQRYILSMLRFPFAHPVHVPRGRLLAERVGAYENNPSGMTQIAQSSPHPSTGSCRFLRGKVGNWVQDMDYAARSAQYRTPLRHYSGNAENLFQKNVKNGNYGDLKYRPPTTYRWEENRYEKCQPSLMTRDNVCDVLPSMGIQRIFILGDSLNLQMAQSIWMMLTTEEAGDSPTPRGTLEPNFEAMITCTSGYQIKVVFVRNDELLENDLPVSVDGENQNCHTYSYPWTQKYLHDDVKTVFFVNAGAHIHSFDLFTAMIDRFVRVFDGLNRPDDLVLFRTLVPGHWDCSRPGLAPFKTFDEYMKDSAAHQSPQTEAVYGWDKFSPYNDYAVNVIDRRRFQTSHTPKALMEVVDVYQTTILRPDGHCSDEYRPPAYSTTDCLHYTLPGPIDWWNHLAFSHLVDIGRQQSTHNEEFRGQDAQGLQRQPEQQQNQYRLQNDQQRDGQTQGGRDDYDDQRQVVKPQNLYYSQPGQQDEDTQQQQYSNHLPSGLEQGGNRQNSKHQQGHQQEGPQTQQWSYQNEPNNQHGYQKQSKIQQNQDYHARGYQQHEGTQQQQQQQQQSQSQNYQSKQTGENVREDYQHQGVQQHDQSGYHQQGHIQTGQNYQQGNQEQNVKVQNQQGYQQSGGPLQSQSYQQQGGQQ